MKLILTEKQFRRIVQSAINRALARKELGVLIEDFDNISVTSGEALDDAKDVQKPEPTTSREFWSGNYNEP